MSRGSRIIPVRVKPELLAKIQETIKRRNANTSDAPWTMTDFFLAAVQDKLRHLERARHQRCRRRKASPADMGVRLSADMGVRLSADMGVQN